MDAAFYKDYKGKFTFSGNSLNQQQCTHLSACSQASSRMCDNSSYNAEDDEGAAGDGSKDNNNNEDADEDKDKNKEGKEEDEMRMRIRMSIGTSTQRTRIRLSPARLRHICLICAVNDCLLKTANL